MFQYKCTIFREHKIPHLKPIANEKLLFTRFYSSIVDVDYVKKVQLVQVFKNLRLKYD